MKKMAIKKPLRATKNNNNEQMISVTSLLMNFKCDHELLYTLELTLELKMFLYSCLASIFSTKLRRRTAMLAKSYPTTNVLVDGET